jgi:D-alanine-D-alanine ligase
MRIIIIYNKDLNNVISKFGRQNYEIYPEITIKKIASIFLEHGYDVRLIDGNFDMFEKLRDLSAEKDKIPFVFNLAYGIQGECRYSHIPSILEMLGLPYFGSGPFGHTLALDKPISKILMRDHRIPTPFFLELNSPDDLDQEIEFPVILKPAMEADSFGVTIANNKDELREMVTCLLDEFNQTVLAEKFIRGRELSLGLLGNGNNVECLPLVEIDLGGNPEEIYTNKQKMVAPRPKLVPDGIPPRKIKAMEQQAKHFFSLLRLKDYARADIRLDAQGKHWFLEINSMASLVDTGSFMAAAEIAGYSYDEMIIKLLEVAMSKYFLTHQKLRLRTGSKP